MTPEAMKNRSRGFGVQMSGEAVAKRLDTVSRLNALGLALRRVKTVGPVRPTEPDPPKKQKGR
jgi:hypothetical protein